MVSVERRGDRVGGARGSRPGGGRGPPVGGGQGDEGRLMRLVDRLEPLGAAAPDQARQPLEGLERRRGLPLAAVRAASKADSSRSRSDSGAPPSSSRPQSSRARASAWFQKSGSAAEGTSARHPVGRSSSVGRAARTRPPSRPSAGRSSGSRSAPSRTRLGRAGGGVSSAPGSEEASATERTRRSRARRTSAGISGTSGGGRSRASGPRPRRREARRPAPGTRRRAGPSRPSPRDRLASHSLTRSRAASGASSLLLGAGATARQLGRVGLEDPRQPRAGRDQGEEIGVEALARAGRAGGPSTRRNRAARPRSARPGRGPRRSVRRPRAPAGRGRGPRRAAGATASIDPVPPAKSSSWARAAEVVAGLDQRDDPAADPLVGRGGLLGDPTDPDRLVEQLAPQALERVPGPAPLREGVGPDEQLGLDVDRAALVDPIDQRRQTPGPAACAALRLARRPALLRATAAAAAGRLRPRPSRRVGLRRRVGLGGGCRRRLGRGLGLDRLGVLLALDGQLLERLVDPIAGGLQLGPTRLARGGPTGRARAGRATSTGRTAIPPTASAIVFSRAGSWPSSSSASP